MMIDEVERRSGDEEDQRHDDHDSSVKAQARIE